MVPRNPGIATPVVGAVIAPPLVDAVHRNIGGQRREVSNPDFEVRNLDFTAGARLATLQL
jgi:hypothetical protein